MLYNITLINQTYKTGNMTLTHILTLYSDLYETN